jgi:hypothetical protein
LKFLSLFLEKAFRHGFFFKNNCVVFLNPPCRETPKNVTKKSQEKKVRMAGGWGWDFSNVRGGAAEKGIGVGGWVGRGFS